MRPPSDSAGFYWITTKIAYYADQTHLLEAYSVDTDHGRKTYYRSQSFWKASASVNLPSAVKDETYAGLNGFDSRCCAYGVAIAVLSEKLLPNEKNQPTLAFPKDFDPRK